MSFTDSIAPAASTAMLDAIRRLMRPLVRLLIRRGVTFPVFAELLRMLYVDVAVHDLLTDPKGRTDSRISLMTGVHRKEIRRLREAGPTDAGVEPTTITIAAQIIARWLAMADTRHDGVPPPLPRSADSAGSFDALVASVTTDVRPRAVLEAWIGQGIVRVDDADRVHLDVAALLPRPGTDEQLFFLGRNLHDHGAAAAANILADSEAPFLDRAAHYDGLLPETARRIEIAAREIAMRGLLEVNRLALDLIAKDEAEGRAPSGSARVNFGAYVYREDADQTTGQSGQQDAPAPSR